MSLETFVEEVMKLTTDNFQVFFATIFPPKGSEYLPWDTETNDSFIDFLKIAELNNVKVIYVGVLKGEDEFEGHEGDIAIVNVGYLIGGVFHVFQRRAKWFDEKYDQEEELTKASKKELEEKTTEDLSNEMLSYVEKEYPELLKRFDKNLLNSLEVTFWESKGIQPRSLGMMEQVKLAEVSELFKAKLGVKLGKIEEKLVESLIYTCIQWLHKKGISKSKDVLKGHIDQFLKVHGKSLSNLGRDSLHSQVKFHFGTKNKTLDV